MFFIYVDCPTGGVTRAPAGLKLEARVNFYERSVAIYGARAVGRTVGNSLDGSGPWTRYFTLPPLYLLFLLV